MTRILFLTLLLSVESVALAETGHDASGDEATVARDVARGFGLPWTALARHDGAPTVATLLSGWDGARDAAVLETAAELRIAARVAVRGGATYIGRDGTLAPVLTGSLDALREERHGVDLAVSGGYEAEGFNLTPAIAARLAIGRTAGATRLTGNVGVGIGTEEGERYGDLRLSALHRVSSAVYAGVDSRGRVDLERDLDEPPGEPDWEVVAGPVAAYARGRFVVSAAAALTAFQPRLVGEREVGLQLTAGVGSAFR